MASPDEIPEPDESPDIDETGTAHPTSSLRYVEVAQRYDAQQQLDGVRSRLAFSLIGLFALVITGAFALVLTAPLTHLPFVEIRMIIELVITPVVALVSAATGFYFGAQLTGSRRRDQRK